MSSITSISSNSWTMQATSQRSNATKIAEELFSQLDTTGQGYIQKSELQAAFDSISSSSNSSSSSSSTTVDELFSTLDTNSDGKVTQQEFTDTLKQLQDDLEQQLQDSRMQLAMQAGGMGNTTGTGEMPPPDDQGFTEEELTSQLAEIGSSDSERSSLISNVLENFTVADTNGDGKVSFQEAMALQDSSSSSSAATSSSTSTTSSSSSSNTEAIVLAQIMKLMEAYGLGNEASQPNNLQSSLLASA